MVGFIVKDALLQSDGLMDEEINRGSSLQAAVGMLRKISNHHSKAEIKHFIILAKSLLLRRLIVRNLGRVTELT